jgi:hypothetical protein
MVARKTRNRIKRRKTYKQRGSGGGGGGGGGGNSTPVDDSHKEAYNEYLKIYALAYDTKDRSVKFEAYKQWLAWKEKYSSLLQFVHIDSRTYLDNLQQYTPDDDSDDEPTRGPTNGYYDGGPYP